MRGDDADALRRVNRAAAADRDETVAARLLVFGSAGVDQVDRRVGLDPIEDDGLHVRGSQRLERCVEQAGRLDSWIRDQQRPADP